MKLLIISSLYSPLRSSVTEKIWHPEGMPAFTGFLEALEDKKIEFDVILRGMSSDNGIRKNKMIKFREFSGNFHIISFPYFLNTLKKFKKLDPFTGLIADVIHTVYCLRIISGRHYDVFYFDRANVTTGAFFAFFLRKNVFLRLHGVITLSEQFDRIPTRLAYLAKYISFRAPFKYVLCSKDGSPAETFLKRFTGRKVSTEVLLNGVNSPFWLTYEGDGIRRRYNIPEDVPVILFVGRLEESKGCSLLVRSLCRLRDEKKKFFSLIVGGGSLYKNISSFLKKCNLNSQVVLTGSVGHEDIYRYYAASDIYVSLNYHGNLSNTVLEAAAAGKCIVTFGEHNKPLRDADTQSLLRDCAVFIERDNASTELTEALKSLIENPKRIVELGKKTSILAEIRIKPWEQRINYEVELLKKVAFG